MPHLSFKMLLCIALFVLSFCSAPSSWGQQAVLLRFAQQSPAAEVVDAYIDSLGQQVLAKAGMTAKTNAVSAPAAHFYELKVPPAGQRMVYLSSTHSLSYWQSLSGMYNVVEDRPNGLEARNGVPNDPLLAQQWQLERTDALRAWEYTRGGLSPSGHRIVIGVIEVGGYDLQHPELQGQLYINTDEVPNDSLDNDGNGYIDDVTGYNFHLKQNNFQPHFHGTQVAGILAANTNNGEQTAGLAAEAKLLPFQIMSQPQWVLALDYLSDLRNRFNASGGADGAYVVVANCSFGAGGECSTDWQELGSAIDRAGEVGILTVGATSNNARNVDLSRDVPSSCVSDYLITVTASSKTDSVYLGSGYSSTQIDLAAPGEKIYSIVAPAGGQVTHVFGSTSGAAPQVSATVALLYSADCGQLELDALSSPAATALRIKSLILDHVDVTLGLSGRTVSNGRLNIARSVEALIGSERCAPARAIVAFSDTAPPAVIPREDAPPMTLLDTISTARGLYRYAVGIWTPGTTTAWQNQPGVRQVEPDYQLLATTRQVGLVIDEQARPESILPGALERLREVAHTGTITPSFQARFDLSPLSDPAAVRDQLLFNTDEIPDNGVDDDGNGFIDDREFVDLDRGISATLVGYGLQVATSLTLSRASACASEAAPLDPRGRTWLLQGHSFGDWLKGAYLVEREATNYLSSNGARGLPLTVYAAAVHGGASMDERLPRTGVSFASQAVGHLLDVGVVTVLPAVAPASPANASLAGDAFGAILVSEAGIDTDLSSNFAQVSSRYSAEFPCNSLLPALQSVGGAVVGVAEVAALASALRSVDCAAPALSVEAAAAQAARVAAAVVPDAPVLGADQPVVPRLNARLSAAIYYGPCRQEGDGCSLVLLAPNPAPAGTAVRAAYSASPSAGCAVTIFDAVGRVVAVVPARGSGELTQVDLATEVLAAGLYFLRLGEGRDATSHPFVLLNR